MLLASNTTKEDIKSMSEIEQWFVSIILDLKSKNGKIYYTSNNEWMFDKTDRNIHISMDRIKNVLILKYNMNRGDTSFFIRRMLHVHLNWRFNTILYLYGCNKPPY